MSKDFDHDYNFKQENEEEFEIFGYYYSYNENTTDADTGATMGIGSVQTAMLGAFSGISICLSLAAAGVVALGF